jgi:hypothetical protein
MPTRATALTCRSGRLKTVGSMRLRCRIQEQDRSSHGKRPACGRSANSKLSPLPWTQLSDHYLSRDRPLAAARVLWEIGEQGCEVRTLRSRLAPRLGLSQPATTLARGRGTDKCGPRRSGHAYSHCEAHSRRSRRMGIARQTKRRACPINVPTINRRPAGTSRDSHD